jgi:predicted ester cyclase
MNKGKQIKYAVEQLIGKGNIDIVDEIFVANYIAHAENKEHKGIEFIKLFSKISQTSIPDICVLKVEILAEENNTISWQRTLQGTHKENMMRIPASNKKIKWNEMIVSRFEKDKIAEEWIISELMGQLMLKQSKNGNKSSR